MLALPAAAARAESPYAEVLPEVGLLNGRLRPCSSTFNCVSTASKSADQYAGPWSVPAGVEDATAAAGLLVSTLRTLYTAEVVASEALPGGQAYRRVEIQGKYSTPDVVEFLVKPSASMGDPNKRDGQLIVTFRSCAGGVKFVYPFMTPLSDGGLQPQRLNALREKLGWGKVGCELAECYAG